MSAKEEPHTVEGLDIGRVLIIVPDHWTRVLLRAELLEHSFDTVGASSIKAALNLTTADERGPIRVVLLDEGALSTGDETLLESLVTRYENAPIVLLASAFSEPRVGPFRRIVRRPTSIQALVNLVHELWGETSPSFVRKSSAASNAFITRSSQPWPAIWCRICGQSRHGETVRHEQERQRVNTDFRKFMREHLTCIQEWQRRSPPSQS
jgi:hypothetical protein